MFFYLKCSNVLNCACIEIKYNICFFSKLRFRNANLCGAVAFCTENVWHKQMSSMSDETKCKICSKAVEGVHAQLQGETIQKDLRMFLEGACRLVRSEKVQTTCFKFVELFAADLMESLVSKITSDTVCEKLWTCKSSSNDFELMNSFIQDDDERFAHQFALENDILIDESIELLDTKPNDIDCIVCKEIAANLK